MNIPEGWPTKEMIEVGSNPDLIPKLAPMHPWTKELHDEVLAKRFNAMIEAAPTKHLTVSTDEAGNAVAVTWQSDEHQILDVIWERKSAPTPPEVEPIFLTRGPGHASYLHIDSYSVGYYKRMGWAVWVATPVDLEVAKASGDVYARHTTPPSPKAEYSASGEPLNLQAAAENAVSFLLTGYPESLPVITNLRKFLGEK
jgi:hypothetical protein